MNKEILSQMVDIFKGIADKWSKIDELVGIDTGFLGNEWSAVSNLIGDYIGMSKIETEYFSRDMLTNLLYDYGEDKINKDFVIEQLIIWSKFDN